MIKMEQLYYLTQIAKYGSINKAAESLYMTSSAISASMKKLEKECGDDILERTYSGVKFTENGKLVLEQAKKILSMVNALKLPAEPKCKVKHKLYIPRQLFKMLSKKILSASSNVLEEFDIVEVEDVEQCRQQISEMDVMIDVIRKDVKFKYDKDENLWVEYLYHTKRYPVSNKNTKYINSNVQCLTMQDLEALPKIKLKGDNVLPDKNVVLTTDDPMIYGEAILNDLGVGVISQFSNDIFVVDRTMFKIYEPLENTENYLAIIANKTCDKEILKSLKEKIMNA